jgi:hypothetical protein
MLPEDVDLMTNDLSQPEAADDRSVVLAVVPKLSARG